MADEAPPRTIFDPAEVLRAEADAIHGSGSVDPGASGKQLYRRLNDLGSAALCLSGGGIRSAAFALGVIQALATHPRPGAGKQAKPGESLLAGFHYLSTVSGGGYIGSWLSAWVARVGFAKVWQGLVDLRQRPEDEAREIAWLRRYSNYLTPKLGVLSADAWAAVALSLRNLILNWLVILPVLCAVLLVLKLVAVGAAWLGKYPPDACSDGIALLPFGLAFLCLVASARFGARHRPTRGHERVTQSVFLWWDLLPAVVSGMLVTLSLAFPCAYMQISFHKWGGSTLIIVGAIAGAVAYAAGWLLAWPRYRNARDFWGDLLAWIVAGAVYGTLIGVLVTLHKVIYGQAAQPEWLHWLLGLLQFHRAEIVLLVFGVPWALTAQLLAEMIFVGLSSFEKGSDSDREWLGRAAGWFLATAIGWMLVMFLSLVAALFVVELYMQVSDTITGKVGTSLLGIASAVATAVLGRSSRSPATAPAKDWSGFLVNLGLAIAAPVFAAALVIGSSAVLDAILLGEPLLETTSIHGPDPGDILPPWPEPATSLLVGLAVTGAIGFVASKCININRFSLHALYRNRLVRAFLGASNPARQQDPFTGFDQADNLPVTRLWTVDQPGWRPFHVINMALNVVATRNLAWQERKAESFTMSPLHAGSPCKQFRSSSDYGDGITLGTAVAISGAAASPNMGYHSSPAVTLLLALLNVRLGWWLGNPGPEGEDTYRREGPRTAITPILEEAFGLTTDDSPYVYLSDGGHFENLGLYEMVRRRCRFIVVSDAGCDPELAFEDLGNAVRKIRLDLGVAIRMVGLEALKKRPTDGSDLGAGAPYHAIGEIDYPAADCDESGNGSRKGLILYIKPGYRGTESVDIRNYATANPDFPHQSTADQWFGESQFESYRALGFEIMDGVLSSAFARLGYPAAASIDRILQAIAESVAEAAMPKRKSQERAGLPEPEPAKDVAAAGGS